MSPGTEFARDFCAGIGPLQLGVVLVFVFFKNRLELTHILYFKLILLTLDLLLCATIYVPHNITICSHMIKEERQ